MKRRKRIRSLASAAGWMLLLSLCATAIPVQTKTVAREKPDWEDKIVPGSQLTVRELARRMMPDIKSDPNKADKITASDLSGIRLVGRSQRNWDGARSGLERWMAATDSCCCFLRWTAKELYGPLQSIA
ncbi:MAG: hypothetical protein DMF60_16895 [Acidobacteria bacterium]|nr:MAG: hypothetical protein DMF60_16895 [Acidobacteriota bacterium]